MKDVTEQPRPQLSRRAIVGFVVTSLVSASLLLLLFLRLLTANQAIGNSGFQSIVGHAAPDFTAPLLNGDAGQNVHLASLKGKPVVLNFWGSWCIPCGDEAPVLEAASKQYAAQGVVFLGIAEQDSPGNSLRFIQQYGITYLMARDGKDDNTLGTVSIAYGVPSPPMTIFINAQGVVVDEFTGTLSKNLLDTRVAKILA